MASFRGLRKIPSLKSIVARKKRPTKYTDFTQAKKISSPAVEGTRTADKVRKL